MGVLSSGRVDDMESDVVAEYLNSDGFGKQTKTKSEKTKQKNHTEMTQEEMAVAIALDMSGEKPLSRLDRMRISTDLYEAIRRMVFQLALKYEKSCGESSEDLFQDCMARIISQLWRFDPAKAKFTTWSWLVCRSVLNRKYRDNKRINSVVVNSDAMIMEDGYDIRENLSEDIETEKSKTASAGVGIIEMMDAIRTLASKYPDHQKLIFELFGNPEEDNYVMPKTISIAEASKAVGFDYLQARLFFKNVIRPFFRENFVGA